jgi:thioredoxin 1
MAPRLPVPPSPSSLALNDSTVPATLELADHALWVVCLCADWCGACREYRPLFEQVAHAHPQLRFAWVDIEDHADLADDFDVETFPTILVAGEAGTRFLGPLLPHAETLSRLLGALQPAQASVPEVTTLLEALAREPATFSVD